MKKLTLVALAALLAVTTAHAGWWQTFGGTERDEGTCVQQTSDGGYIVTGVTWSFGRIGERDMWLIKLDSLGHKEWDRTYEGGWGKCVRPTNDKGYIIAGSRLIKTDASGDTIWVRTFGAVGQCVQVTNDDNYIVVGAKSTALWLTKINENGNTLWERTYQKGNYEDVGNYVEQTSDDGYIITGVWIEEDPELQYWKTGLWLLKTDSLGDTLWTRSYGGEEWGVDMDRGNCVRQTDDGGFIIAGNFDGYILIKTDGQGDTLWHKIPTGEGRCVEQTLDGGYILTGGTKAATLLSEPGYNNLWLIKTDADGDTAWIREYGGGGTDAGRYVEQTSDSGYIVTGYTWSFGAGVYDVYLLKTDSLGLLAISEPSIKEKQVDWEVVQSMGNNIQIRYSNRPQGFRANIYNSLGQKVDELHAVGSSGNVVWGLGYPSGVYFVRVANRNKENNTARIVLIR